MTITRRLLAVVALTTAAGSCGGDSSTGTATPAPTPPTAPIAPVVPVTASLYIDSVVPRLYVGRTAQLAFQVRDKDGAAVAGRTITWSSSAPSVATVSANALLTGLVAGSVTITGTVDGISASRSVTVFAVPSAFVSVKPEVGTLARGVELALITTTTDIDGKPVTGNTLTFTSSDPAVATVSASGVVRPIATGAANITAVVNGQEQAIARFTVLEARTVSGVVATADGSPVQPLVFAARFNTGASIPQLFLASVDAATGAFALVMPAFPSTGPSIEYFIDAPTGTARTYHPAWMRLTNGTAPSGSRILLIPRAVTPDSGTYAGQRIPVSLNDAFTAVCSDTSNANCQSYWPSYFLTGIKNWADAARPIPVAFDRTTGSLAAADSVAFWDVVKTMEADVGRRLFKPANFTAFTSTGYTLGMVLVSHDPALTGFGGYTNWSWDSQGVVYQARIRFSQSRYLANNSLGTHELNHALGFHHTCRWQTIMGGYGCGQDGRLSVNDVAYFHLAEQVRRVSAVFRPNWTIGESLQGARVLELGLPAPESLPQSISASLSKLPIAGSDGAP